MSHPLRKRYISANKYEMLETYEGALAALRRLQKDIGSKADIQVSECKEKIGDDDPLYLLTIPDITIAFGTLKEREIMPGSGVTLDAAASYQLAYFLRAADMSYPEQQTPSFLAVGEITGKPRTIVHVVRPQKEANSNVVRLAF